MREASERGGRGANQPVGQTTWLVRLAGTALALALSAGCHKAGPSEAELHEYRAEIARFRDERRATLTAEDGWLALAGLFWLHEGDNRAGAGAEVALPQGKAPADVGVFRSAGGRVRFEPAAGVGARIDKGPRDDGSLATDTDAGGPSVVRVGPISMLVILRAGKLGVRVRDAESAARRDFAGIDAFDADPSWRLRARVEPYAPPKRIAITNILGMTEDEPSPGALVFEREGQIYRLDAVEEAGTEKWFVMFADRTSGHETYGGGRYLYVTKPGPDGTTTVDFNRSTLPPCALTRFATCPLPPSQNRLALRVAAGERATRGGHP